MTTTPDRLIHTEPDKVIPYDRCIKYRWTLLEEPTDMHGRPATHFVYVTLDCTHHGRSQIAGRLEYALRAVLMHEDITVGERFTRTSIRVGGGGALHVATEECKRFSQKRLEDFTDHALNDLLNRRDETDVKLMYGEDA